MVVVGASAGGGSAGLLVLMVLVMMLAMVVGDCDGSAGWWCLSPGLASAPGSLSM